MTWTPPSEFEEYRIVRPLGAGSMGQVFLAHDVLLDRPVAIKFVSGIEISAGARERFFTEARAVARLSHPNVVAIHRVGEVRHRPYLVSEYLRGQTLAALAKPVPWQRALQLALGLARGLGSAHQRGVLHRDIKPANAMLGENDEAKLLDFGLAKLVAHDRLAQPRSGAPAASPAVLACDETVSMPGGARPGSAAVGDGETEGGTIVGTPLYLAPELWRGQPASMRSDVYSLGIVLYELIAGRAPHAGLELAELAERVHAGADPIGARVADLPSRFAALIDACVHLDPSRRPGSGDELLELLESLTPRDVDLDGGSPYRGLSTFEPEHRAVFFGRAHETREVVERLRAETLVVIAGDSGAGKSSLCRAGVLPAIAETSIAGRRWQIVTMEPGLRPEASLDAALASRIPGDGLLLFVDQLEELVTLASPPEAARVAERLAELVVASSDIRILASARSDFLGRLAALPGIGALLGRALYLLGPLGERGLREAIVAPARAFGYEFESTSTVEALIDSGRRHLPLMQFTLAALWDARDDKRRLVPADALHNIGGVAGALAGRADQVMAALGAADREVAWAVFTRLMTADGTRAVMTREQLGEAVGDQTAVERVVERLVDARLLVVEEDRVAVVHEALLSAWPRLVEWRRTHDEGTRLRDLQAEAASRWHERGRPRGLLWRGDALAEYRMWRRRWHEKPTGIEAAFLAASEADLRQGRRLRGLVLGLVLAALSVGVVVLYRSEGRAARERDVAQLATAAARGAERQSTEQRDALVLHQARTELDHDPTAALAWLASYPSEAPGWNTVSALAADAGSRMVARHVWRGPGSFSSIALSPDGRFVTAGGDQRGLRIWEIASGRLRVLESDITLGGPVLFSPDGRWVATSDGGEALRVFELSSGTRRAVVAPAGRLRFSGDSKWLVAVGAMRGVTVFDVTTGKTTALPVDATVATAAGFVGDGGQLAIVDAKAVTIVDLETAKHRVVGLHHVDWAWSVTASADARLLVVGGGGVTMALFDLVRGTHRILTAPGYVVSRAAFSPAGELYSYGARPGFWRWDLVTGTPTEVIGPDTCRESVFADHGLVVFGGEVTRLMLWDPIARVGRPLLGHEDPVLGIAASRDRKRIASIDARSLRVWQLDEGLIRVVTNTQGPAALSPDNKWVLASTTDTQGVRVVEVGTGTVTEVVKARQFDIWNPSGAIAPDGSAAVFSDRDQMLTKLHFPSLRTEPLVRYGPPGVLDLAEAFSPDGKLLAIALNDGAIKLLDLATRKLRLLGQHTAKPIALDFTRDSRWLASAGRDDLVKLWDLTTGAVRTLKGHVGDIYNVTFSRDGSELYSASADGSMRVWNLATGTSRRLTGHAGEIETINLLPQLEHIATGGADGTVRIWNLATGDNRIVWRGASAVWAIEVATDGSFFLALGADFRMSLFDPRTNLGFDTDPARLRAWIATRTTARIDPSGVLATPTH